MRFRPMPIRSAKGQLAKLKAIITVALKTGLITFTTIEKLAGKCTSTTVAVPAASLYTFHMYKQIGKFHRTRLSRVSATATVAGSLRDEMKMWLELRLHLNGAPWSKAFHQVLSVTGATDASSSGWGGVMRGPSGVAFKAAGGFPGEMASEHINVKEAYALLESLQLYCKTQPLEIKGSTAVVDAANMTVFHAFSKGRSKNAQLHE